MIALDDKHLLMIEPKHKPDAPIDDDLTAKAAHLFMLAQPDKIRYRGFHACVCGKCSDSADWILLGGLVTNSLMFHYVREHRSEVPQGEIVKLIDLHQRVVIDDMVE